jgi:hypothetical protein
MTEKQKKLAIIIGTVIIGIIILFWSRRATGGTTIVNQQGLAPIQVTIPSLNIPERSPIAINIPGLPAFTPYDFNAISPCMCNGAASLYQDTSNSGPAYEFVYNEGDSGPNVYNYYAPVPTYNTTSQPIYGMGG